MVDMLAAGLILGPSLKPGMTERLALFFALYELRHGFAQQPVGRGGRSSSGYRCYDLDAVDRLGFIRHGRQLGLDLRTIGELLALADHPDADCRAVDAIASKRGFHAKPATRGISGAVGGRSRGDAVGVRRRGR